MAILRCARSTAVPHEGLSTAAVIASMFAAVVLGFASTWSDMASVWWTSETFSHGMLVPALAAWLAWRGRDRLAALTPAVSWHGTAAVATACIAWLSGTLANVNVVAQFAVTAMIPAIVWAVAGGRVARALAAPLAFLVFMVPAGEALNPFLMDATTDATIWTLVATGIPVFREGLHFTLPTGRRSVIEACSGLRYVTAAAMLGALFATINFTRTRQRIMFIAVALIAALVANWMRAYIVVVIGHLSGMRLSVGDDHIVYGWMFFGMVMFTIFWIGAR